MYPVSQTLVRAKSSRLNSGGLFFLYASLSPLAPSPFGRAWGFYTTPTTGSKREGKTEATDPRRRCERAGRALGLPSERRHTSGEDGAGGARPAAERSPLQCGCRRRPLAGCKKGPVPSSNTPNTLALSLSTTPVRPTKSQFPRLVFTNSCITTTCHHVFKQTNTLLKRHGVPALCERRFRPLPRRSRPRKARKAP